MKHIDETEPQDFRSRLEHAVASELVRLGVDACYEKPLSPSVPVPYLPDFTIRRTEEAIELELPIFLEVKPQQQLYDLYDVLGLNRYPGPYFKEPFFVKTGSQFIKDHGFEELWKPKALAEWMEADVLVTGYVRSLTRLSATMQRHGIIWSRSHPFVNQGAIEKERAKEERQREHDRMNEERRIEAARRREEEWKKKQREYQERLRSSMIIAAEFKKQSVKTIKPKYSSPCSICEVSGKDGELHRVNDEWKRVCKRCAIGAHK